MNIHKTSQNVVGLASYIRFSQCFFKNMTTSYQYFFAYFDLVPIYLSLYEVYLLNNSMPVDRGAFIYIYNGDNMNISFNKMIFRHNYMILIESYYMNSIEFIEVYVWNHNLNLADNSIIKNSYFLTYIESTMYFIFYKFFLNGANSDLDVAGIKIHINNLLYNRNGNRLTADIVQSRNLSIIFRNCIFNHALSLDYFWLDGGSAMAFHSDLPFSVYFYNIFCIGNGDDKGATCLETYGQKSLNWYIYDSFFLNNTSERGSACLSLWVISFYIQNCYFIGNTLKTYQGNINLFTEGTTGGAIVSETNNVTIKSSFFIRNAAYQAGAIYLFNPKVIAINVSIDNCTFQGNLAKMGGAISLSMVYHQVNLSLRNNYFKENQGFNGGCLYFALQSPLSLVNIQNNTFIGN